MSNTQLMEETQFIQVLEHHKKGLCVGCPLRDTHKSCGVQISTMALNIINSQNSEIEKYKREHLDIDNFARDLCRERMLKGKAVADFEDLQEHIKKQVAEKITKFVDRLKGDFYSYVIDVTPSYIDNLVKEIMEEQG
jgi:uncharacterized protein (DUF305 family)